MPMTDDLPRRTLLKTKEAAAVLDVTPRAIRFMIDDERLEAVRIGKVIRIRRSVLEAYLESLQDKVKGEKEPVKKRESENDVYVVDRYLAGFKFARG
jgi:excisionase family DNA binding protein